MDDFQMTDVASQTIITKCDQDLQLTERNIAFISYFIRKQANFLLSI